MHPGWCRPPPPSQLSGNDLSQARRDGCERSPEPHRSRSLIQSVHFPGAPPDADWPMPAGLQPYEGLRCIGLSLRSMSPLSDDYALNLVVV